MQSSDANGLNSIKRRQTMDRMMREQGGRCFYCCKTMRRDVRSRHADRATIEHRIPRAHGGTNDQANLVAACRTCNTVKAERSEAEYMSIVAAFLPQPVGQNDTTTRWAVALPPAVCGAR